MFKNVESFVMKTKFMMDIVDGFISSFISTDKAPPGSAFKWIDNKKCIFTVDIEVGYSSFYCCYDCRCIYQYNEDDFLFQFSISTKLSNIMDTHKYAGNKVLNQQFLFVYL